jgi:hypothetical protein
MTDHFIEIILLINYFRGSIYLRGKERAHRVFRLKN